MVQKNPNAEVLVLDDNGTNLGRMPYCDAQALASSRDLDLVQVNKDGTFKIMDHGKYKYSKKKNQQKKVVHPLKEITFKMRIDPHDAKIKINRIKSFLSKGSDVKIAVTMRGRERAMPHLAHEKLDFILKELEGLVVVQQKRAIGASVFATIRPVPEAKILKKASKEPSQKSTKKNDDKEPAIVRWRTVRKKEENEQRTDRSNSPENGRKDNVTDSPDRRDASPKNN